MREKKPLVREAVTQQHVKKYKLTEKVCPVCREKFLGTGKAIYDKPACKRKADYEKHGEEYRRQQREKYHATQRATK